MVVKGEGKVVGKCATLESAVYNRKYRKVPHSCSSYRGDIVTLLSSGGISSRRGRRDKLSLLFSYLYRPCLLCLLPGSFDPPPLTLARSNLILPVLCILSSTLPSVNASTSASISTFLTTSLASSQIRRKSPRM